MLCVTVLSNSAPSAAVREFLVGCLGCSSKEPISLAHCFLTVSKNALKVGEPRAKK